MLYATDNGKLTPVTEIPHKMKYFIWLSKLSHTEYNAIINELNRRIDGTEIKTSSLMPGNDWTGTVFEPIYTKACGFDEEQSVLFFGLIVWLVLMDRPEAWSFGRYEKDRTHIKGITYFRIN
jgi:hypothetical protein